MNHEWTPMGTKRRGEFLTTRTTNTHERDTEVGVSVEQNA